MFIKFLFSSNFPKHNSYELTDEGIKEKPSDNSKYTTASWLKKNSRSEMKSMYLTNTLQSQNFNALLFFVLFFYLISGALEWDKLRQGLTL